MRRSLRGKRCPEHRYDCVDFVDPTTTLTPCREFEFESNNGVQWGSFHFDIVWDYDSEPDYPNGDDPSGADPGQVRILQNKGGHPPTWQASA